MIPRRSVRLEYFISKFKVIVPIWLHIYVLSELLMYIDIQIQIMLIIFRKFYYYL